MYSSRISIDGTFEVSVNGYHVEIQAGPERKVVFKRGWVTPDALSLGDEWCDARHKILIEAIKQFESAVSRVVEL